MSRIRQFPCWFLALWPLLPPSDALAQERNAAEVLRTLRLDSLRGAITAYYSPGYAERARTLHTWYCGAMAHYQSMCAGDSVLNLTTSLALLDPEQWSGFTTIPSGRPHIEFTGWPPLIAVLPSANDRGLMADTWRKLGLTSRLELGRAVDVIGLHGFGHSLSVQHLYVLRDELPWDRYAEWRTGELLLWLETSGPALLPGQRHSNGDCVMRASARSSDPKLQSMKAAT